MENQQLEIAEKDIKNAWMAGAASTIITLIVALIGTYSDDFRYQYGYDIWNLLDVVLIGGLTYGVYRKKRFCALGLFVYFIASKLLVIISTGQFSGGILSVLFIYFYFKGMMSAFDIHKHLLETGQITKEKKAKGIGYYILAFTISLVVLAFCVLAVIGVMSPELEVIPGKQINKKYIDFVKEEGMIDYSEEIQYWYSDGFGDFKKGFYFFTDDKVVVYSNEWEEPALIVPYSEIMDIEFYRNTSSLEDSQINLVLTDSSTVFFPVSSDNDGDIKFNERLLEVWNSKLDHLELGE